MRMSFKLYFESSCVYFTYCFSVSINQIGDAGATALAAALPHCPALIRLEFVLVSVCVGYFRAL